MAQALQTVANYINSASSKYGVPAEILLGVFGKETDFGKDDHTSSTGAMGDMQFEPGTASEYGYPMTDNPTPAQEQQQFDSAAEYLASLYKSSGNWNTALQAYSGGGYGLQDVLSEAKNASGNFSVGIGSTVSIPNPATAAENAVSSAASSIGSAISNVFNKAVSDLKYGLLLLVMVAVGAFLMFRGISGGGGSSPKMVPVPV